MLFKETFQDSSFHKFHDYNNQENFYLVTRKKSWTIKSTIMTKTISITMTGRAIIITGCHFLLNALPNVYCLPQSFATPKQIFD